VECVRHHTAVALKFLAFDSPGGRIISKNECLMEWKIELDERGDFLRAKQWEMFSLEEQAYFLSDIFSAPDWQPGFPLLIDYTNLLIGNIDSRQMERITEFFARMRSVIGAGRIALLSQSDVQFGLGRQFQMLVDTRTDAEIGVFRDEQAAVEWLLLV